ncbi:glycosyltransferase [Aeromicrobium endophyticum]|uniref:Glycosyltransferase n=1 Tax=Aeromicrobium endophyticum TaxID=2292704 RepID=A0A371PEU8_9ACTN|nr:glycosyltransferase [Aeromicrobium endophyticum]
MIGTRGYPSYYGGFETAVRHISPHLASRGWDVSVYGRPGQTRPDDAGFDPRVRSVITRGLDSTSLSTLSYGLTACVHAFFRKPDVALVMNVANGFWLPLLRLRGIPTVVNVDGIEWHRAKWGRLAKAMFRWGATFTAKFADELVFDAEAIADFWLREFGRTGTFIPYGGETSEPLPVEDGLTSRRYALMVARFVPENTISEFVEAASDISRDYDVVLVGSAPEGSRLHAEVSELDGSNPRVHWLGHVNDDRRLYSLWQHSGAYFHGHSVGGTNPALVQAMTLGAPVVARDTVYNREVLADAGLYCSPEPAAIADVVRHMIENSSEYRHKAAERAADAYTWSGVNDAYEAVLLDQLDATAGQSSPTAPSRRVRRRPRG